MLSETFQNSENFIDSNYQPYNINFNRTKVLWNRKKDCMQKIEILFRNCFRNVLVTANTALENL